MSADTNEDGKKIWGLTMRTSPNQKAERFVAWTKIHATNPSKATVSVFRTRRYNPGMKHTPGRLPTFTAALPILFVIATLATPCRAKEPVLIGHWPLRGSDREQTS